MKLSKQQLRRIILESLAEDADSMGSSIARSAGELVGKVGSSSVSDLKKTKIVVLNIAAERPVKQSLADKQTAIIADKLSKILTAKRVVSPENFERFIKKKGLGIDDFDSSVQAADYAEKLGVPVVVGKFGRSPGYKRDRLMRYKLEIIDSEGDTIARNSTLDVSSDRRSHEQILSGLKELCKQAGLV